MTNFTRSVFRTQYLLLAFMLFAGGNVLLSQTHSLTITSPASIAGKYDINIAAFGSTTCSFDTIRGNLAIGTDSIGSSLACRTILNDLTGRIVLIDRGECNFTDKANRARVKGAAAVIIINNNIAPNDGSLITIGVTTPQVAVATFSMSLANGTTLKNALTGTVTGFISRKNDDIVLWGAKPGEGDFRNSLNGWTSNTISCAGPGPDTAKLWRWSANGIVRGGCTRDTLLSPTACNGAAVFESDFFDNGGVECAGASEGRGLCPAPQVGELTSPLMTLSSTNTTSDYGLKFYQATRSFTSNRYLIAWSKNNGESWDTTAINTDVTPNSFSDNPSIQRVTLTGTAGAPNLRVKFIWNANYYYWAIDDVQIIEKPSNDLRVNPFYAVPQNGAVPLAHVEPIGFLADVENIGTAAQSGVNLNVTIENQQGASLFSTDLSYGNIPAGTLIENRPFPQQFTPTARGTHFGTYTIRSGATDADATNNTQEFVFVVTDTTFAKDLRGANLVGGPQPAAWDGANEYSWAWGQFYYIPKANNNYFRTVSFSLSADATVANRELLIQIYKWTKDTDEDGEADLNERVSVGFTTYTMKGTETAGTLITVPFPNPEDAPVRLEDNTAYIVMVEYYSIDKNTPDIGFSDEIDYAAMVLLNNDSLNRMRYCAMLAIDADLANAPYRTFAFNDGTGNIYKIQPVVRMSVGANPRTSTTNLNALEGQFLVFPNPTSDVLNVQLNLEKQAQNTTVRLFDLSGKMLQQWNYDNIQQERLRYNVSDLSSGTYFLQVITENGAGIKKFNVTK